MVELTKQLQEVFNKEHSKTKEDLYIERIYNDIMANFEEKIEISNSLKEIEDR